jgi:hypothetical protein
LSVSGGIGSPRKTTCGPRSGDVISRTRSPTAALSYAPRSLGRPRARGLDRFVCRVRKGPFVPAYSDRAHGRQPGHDAFRQSRDKCHLEFYLAYDPRGAPLRGRANDAQLSSTAIPGNCAGPERKARKRPLTAADLGFDVSVALPIEGSRMGFAAAWTVPMFEPPADLLEDGRSPSRANRS